MRKIIPLLVVLLSVGSSLAEDFQYSESLKIDVDVNGVMEIVPESESYSIRSINVNLDFFPTDGFNQKVLELSIEGNGEVADNAIRFKWEEPLERRINFGFSSQVETYDKAVKVRDKVEFPLRGVSSDVEIYTKPAEIIDSDNEGIIRLASELVKGEDDLYRAVFKLAEWTKNNVKYDLSTLTAEVSQKASWVLENREGVCDELTSLFIALNRAVGIPAKFVAGVAYTDSELFEEKWGAHGWAEVYFPGYGWIPFDVTYGEFGYVDATHIKMRESVDSSSSSTEYEWLGRNVDLKTGGLTIKAEVREKGGGLEIPIELEGDAVKNEVGFGSYNLIEVTVRNLKDYYVATELYLSKSESIDVIGGYKRGVLLRPKEEKRVFWIVKVDDDLDANFIYTFNFKIVSLRNASTTLSFKSERRGAVFSREEMEAILREREEKEEREYSRGVDLNCTINRENFYMYENGLISCEVQNTGNVFLNLLEVCLESRCHRFNLGISQKKNLSFPVNYSEAGRKDVAIEARNSLASKTEYVSFDVLDDPKVDINRIDYPKNISFDDEYDVVFVLEKESMSNPLDVEVVFKQAGPKKMWVIDELFENRRFVVKVRGKELSAGRNAFKIIVSYKDGNGRLYKTEEEFFIDLVDVNLGQRIAMLMNYPLRFLNSISFRDLFIVLFVVAAAFVFVVLYVFHTKRGGKGKSSRGI
jgi:transglutaminase-like putative cysteine protease